MKRLRMSFFIATSLVTLSLSLGTANKAHADCAPQTESLMYVEHTDSAGFHQRYIHVPSSNWDCPVDYYSTTIEDQYVIGSVMPTFHFSEDRRGGYDIAQMYNAFDADFSQMSDIVEISMTYGKEAAFTPFNITIIGNDGYNNLDSKNQWDHTTWDAKLGVVNWYALGGDDRIQGGEHSTDISYGGLGNDFYQLDNVEDKAIELPNEGFDVVAIYCKNYKFTYATNIEAIYIAEGASVNMSTVPANVVFLKDLVDNRGQWGTTNIADYLQGTPNSDALYGNAGDDKVVSNKGNDYVEGGRGNDTADAGPGNDTLSGGVGADSLKGGSGVDKFIYSNMSDMGSTPSAAAAMAALGSGRSAVTAMAATGNTPSATDVIVDFDTKKEKIDLSAIDASAVIDGNNAFMFNGGSPIGTSPEGEISFVKVDNPGKKNDYTLVYIDNDADAEPEAYIILKGLKTLSVSNFVL